MQSSNKAKLRLFAKHAVPKQAHKKPEKSPVRAPDTGVRLLTLIPRSSDTAAAVADLVAWQKIPAKSRAIHKNTQTLYIHNNPAPCSQPVSNH